MSSTMTSDVQDRAREIIESAIDEMADTCACGRTMTVDAHGNQVWIECESLRGKRGLRLVIASGFHDRRVVELPAPLGAAA